MPAAVQPPGLRALFQFHFAVRDRRHHASQKIRPRPCSGLFAFKHSAYFQQFLRKRSAMAARTHVFAPAFRQPCQQSPKRNDSPASRCSVLRSNASRTPSHSLPLRFVSSHMIRYLLASVPFTLFFFSRRLYSMIRRRALNKTGPSQYLHSVPWIPRSLPLRNLPLP